MTEFPFRDEDFIQNTNQNKFYGFFGKYFKKEIKE
jgi:hypothetical protein